MNPNALHFSVLRLRGLFTDMKIAYSHVMLFDMLSHRIIDMCGRGIALLAPIAVEGQGSSMPIPTGGPPISRK